MYKSLCLYFWGRHLWSAGCLQSMSFVLLQVSVRGITAVVSPKGAGFFLGLKRGTLWIPLDP